MEIREKFLTQNDCYKQNAKIKPTGIIVHSTATPGVMNEAWYSAWNKSGIEKCVHAFIDDSGVMQTLPWDTLGWHSGTGSLGKAKNANQSYIGFEICEPKGHTYSGGTMVNYDVEKNEAYFNKVYNTAVDLCVYLCKKYEIDVADILDHSEAHRFGIASDHSDVMQWFPKHKKDMNIFRADISRRLGEGKMRIFKLMEDMNFREKPNGKKLDVIPEGTAVSGLTLEESNGIYWLNTKWNGISGYVAVLPQSKQYAVEITDTDTAAEKCVDELAFYKSAYSLLIEKVEKIRDIMKTM